MDSLIDDDPRDSEIYEIDTKIYTYSNPMQFQGSNSLEIRHDKQFHEMLLVIGKHTGTEAKNMNVFEFYNAFENIKKTQKDGNKSNKIRGSA